MEETATGMRSLGIHRHRREDNIRTDLEKNWIDLAQDWECELLGSISHGVNNYYLCLIKIWHLFLLKVWMNSRYSYVGLNEMEIELQILYTLKFNII